MQMHAAGDGILVYACTHDQQVISKQDSKKTLKTVLDMHKLLFKQVYMGFNEYLPVVQQVNF